MEYFFDKLILPQIKQLSMTLNKNIQHSDNAVEYNFSCNPEIGDGFFRAYCFKDYFILSSLDITLNKDVTINSEYPEYYQIQIFNHNFSKYISTSTSSYTNEKNTLVFFSPQNTYNTLIKKNVQFKSFSISLSKQFIKILSVDETTLFNYCFNGSAINSPYALNLLQHLSESFPNSSFHPLYYYSKIIELIALIIQFNKNTLLTTNVISQTDNDLLTNIINYLEENYKNPINIKTLENMFFVSRTKLYTIFKAKFNMSFIEYLKNIRLRQAKNLLKTTDFSILEITKSVGYNNQGSFSEFFKLKTGLTPSEYRKETLKLQNKSE